MDIQNLNEEIKVFSSTTHGSSDYDKDEYFVMDENRIDFAPFKYLQKKFPELKDISMLLKQGYVYDSLDLANNDKFLTWFEKQFSRKLPRREQKRMCVVYIPNNKLILDQIELVTKSYEILSQQQILLNGKNLPTQLGEWYCKCIFGLKQVKSTSQRGFDFVAPDGRRVEVQVESVVSEVKNTQNLQ